MIIIGRIPALPGPSDGITRFVARRVDHPNQTGEHEIALDVRADTFRRQRAVEGRAVGDAQRAQCASRQFVVGRRIARAACSDSGRHASPTSSLRAPREQHVRSAFREQQRATFGVRVRVERAHQLAIGRERHFADTSETARQMVAASPAFCAATISAPSVGSPCTVHWPSLCCNEALFARSATASVRSSSVCRSPVMASPFAWRTSPTGAYPVPLIVTRPLAVTTSRTVISFLVNVPVLSEAMTDADPNVSTALRWRTIAFRRAMR